MGKAKLVALLFGTVIVALASNANAASKLVYAVFWNGCEKACQGFQDHFTDAGINAEMVIRDAEQYKALLANFRQEIREMRPDLVLTYGTSVTCGIAGTLDVLGDPRFNGEIPHVFMVVADPVGARVVESLDSTGRANVTGTFNRVPEAVNINTIRSYLPEFQRLGLIYNSSEANSILKRNEVAGLSKQMGFEVVAVELELAEDGKPTATDIPPAVAELAARDVDFIYLGSSSFLDVNSDLFTDAAVEHGIPVLSPYERLVTGSNALLSVAARYYDVGRLAGSQAEKILVDGMSPGDLPVARMTEFAYVVNMQVARTLNLFPPVEILQIAETVN